MLTFDLALKYLEGTDFSFFKLKNANDKQIDLQSIEINRIIKDRFVFFEIDEDVKKTNRYYRKFIFEMAALHLVFKCNEMISFWDEAMKIIESNKGILNSKYKGFVKGSIIPKKMVNEWLKYCLELKQNGINVFHTGNRMEYFIAAFNYFKKIC